MPSPLTLLQFLEFELGLSLDEISATTGGANVIFYYSSASRQNNSPLTWLRMADVADFQFAVSSMDAQKNLTLILHTPGGYVEAAKQIIQCIHSKFQHVTAIVPSTTMSSGTIITLSCDRIILGINGGLGPMDPLVPVNGQWRQAKLIISEYERAHSSEKPASVQWRKADYLKAKKEYDNMATYLDEMLMMKGRNDRQEILNALYHDPKQHDEIKWYSDLQGLSIKPDLLNSNGPLNEATLRSFALIRQWVAAQKKYRGFAFKVA